MRGLILVLAASLALVACGDKGPTLLPDEVRTEACLLGVAENLPDDPIAVGCDIRVSDLNGVSRCFEMDGQAHACACAGCALENCLLLESYPAQVRCH